MSGAAAVVTTGAARHVISWANLFNSAVGSCEQISRGCSRLKQNSSSLPAAQPIMALTPHRSTGRNTRSRVINHLWRSATSYLRSTRFGGLRHRPEGILYSRTIVLLEELLSGLTNRESKRL
ncbi:hypothetical protein RRG08_044281 [Elysia crispata]|uniref:Uncharacterized protein n=1 Tax=Elysia crispata TaxID=231223 RepID=A0AAE0XXB4_9GAST|nr:hypothetical protein RRG08_044281 [Elysia crispata]